MFHVFFNTSMHTEISSVLPSSKKPALVVAEWRKKFPGKVNICGVPAATVKTLLWLTTLTLWANKLPVVWNLAGGYQVAPDGSIQKVLDIHNNTFRAMVEVFHE